MSLEFPPQRTVELSSTKVFRWGQGSCARVPGWEALPGQEKWGPGPAWKIVWLLSSVEQLCCAGDLSSPSPSTRSSQPEGNSSKVCKTAKNEACLSIPEKCRAATHPRAPAGWGQESWIERSCEVRSQVKDLLVFSPQGSCDVLGIHTCP